MEVNYLRTNRRAQIGNITIPLLRGEQGEQGEQGYSISRVERTSGDGTPGTTDTYTIYINTTPETAIGEFYIINGSSGDMTKAIYDTNNNGIVDNAELVSGFSVGCNVPANAVFTDTIYDDTALTGRVSTLENAGYITRSVSDLANYYLKNETYTKQEVDNAGYITNAVADLANYYLKSETYTKREVIALCDEIPKFAIEVVNALPTQDISETTIYLVRNTSQQDDLYTEYIYVNNTWEILGAQSIDLSNYYTKTEIDDMIGDIETLLASI